MDEYALKKFLEEGILPSNEEPQEQEAEVEEKIYHKDTFYRTLANMSEAERDQMWDTLLEFHESNVGKHFNPAYASYEVSKMCHISNGAKIKGEYFHMDKAEEVSKKYRSIIPECITVADIYVAINYHYHIYDQLYKAWFGNNKDSKLLESAIIFWFNDSTYPNGDKLWDYMKHS